MLCSILVGYNDAFYNVTSDSDWDNMASFPGPNALKVHFVEDGNGWAGIAKRPSSSTPYVCAIDAGSSTSTLTHEIGHNLGLHHTHNPGRSLFADNNGDCDKCNQESVSRSKKQGIGCFLTSISDLKCEVNGDFLCDTPADPELVQNANVVDLNCNYVAAQTDNWNDTWQPDERNIMSYSRRACRNVLTPQQTFVMILNLPSFTLTSPGYFISGPSRLCPNQSATYSVSAISGVTDYAWEVPNGWTISGQGNRTVTITASSNSSGSIRVTPDCGRPGVSKQITNQISTVNVSGPYTICEGESAHYSTSASASSYSWTVFGDMQIISGQGSSSVQVYAPYGAQGGYISVNVNFGQCSGSNGMGVSVISGSGCYQYATAQDDSTATLPEVKESEPVNNVNQRSTLFTKKQFDFSVYPNPGDNRVTLSFDQENSYTIELLDKQGKLIQSTQSICCEKSVDVSTLKQGIYYLRVSSSSSVVTKKIFIQ
jgi:hypothetical protein